MPAESEKKRNVSRETFLPDYLGAQGTADTAKRSKPCASEKENIEEIVSRETMGKVIAFQTQQPYNMKNEK